MARVIARMALAALGLSGDPVHEPVHVRDPRVPVLLVSEMFLMTWSRARKRTGCQTDAG